MTRAQRPASVLESSSQRSVHSGSEIAVIDSMSAPFPPNTSGSYTRESLSQLLREIQATQLSGVLQMMVSDHAATMQFIQGKLVSADLAELGGELAFQGILASQGGAYEFKAGFVQFSQIGMNKRIYASLESLLSTSEVQSLNGSKSVSTGVKPLADFNLEAFDLDALSDDNAPDSPADVRLSAQRMPAGFLKALLSEFVRSVGPAGYVLIEEIAVELRLDLQAMTPAQATRLTAMMVGQVPVSKRNAFQSSCAGFLEQFKP